MISKLLALGTTAALGVGGGAVALDALAPEPARSTTVGQQSAVVQPTPSPSPTCDDSEPTGCVDVVVLLPPVEDVVPALHALPDVADRHAVLPAGRRGEALELASELLGWQLVGIAGAGQSAPEVVDVGLRDLDAERTDLGRELGLDCHGLTIGR